jgi:hypothetical protein
MNNTDQCCVAARGFILHEKPLTRFWSGSEKNSRRWFPVIQWTPTPRWARCALRVRWKFVEKHIQMAVDGSAKYSWAAIGSTAQATF